MFNRDHKAKDSFQPGGPFTSGRGASRGLRLVREFFDLSDSQAKIVGEGLFALSFGLSVAYAGYVFTS